MIFRLLMPTNQPASDPRPGSNCVRFRYADTNTSCVTSCAPCSPSAFPADRVHERTVRPVDLGQPGLTTREGETQRVGGIAHLGVAHGTIVPSSAGWGERSARTSVAFHGAAKAAARTMSSGRCQQHRVEDVDDAVARRDVDLGDVGIVHHDRLTVDAIVTSAPFTVVAVWPSSVTTVLLGTSPAIT